jgi:hypothetical protein
MSPTEVADVMPPATGETGGRRPYFEALFVNSQPAARWPAFAREIRRLRRPEDPFIYEPIIVGSFEDAFCAVASTPISSRSCSPKAFPTARATTRRCCARCSIRSARRRGRYVGVAARARLEADQAGTRHLSALRPQVEKIAGDPDSGCDAARLLRGRGAAGAAPLHPRRRAGAL